MNKQVYRMNYFIYQGTMYGVGTKVILKNSIYYQQDNLYEFVSSFSDGYKVFQNITYNKNGKRVINQIKLDNVEEDIERIVYPTSVQSTSGYQKALDNMVKKKVHPDVFSGCLMYVVIMFVGIFFIDRWLIWIFGTIIFIGWLLNQYKT